MIYVFVLAMRRCRVRKPVLFLALNDRPSIAVLRPRPLGNEPVDPYFIEGIVHGIVASLAGLKELFVISSSSTVALADATTDTMRIGQELGVRYILTGAIGQTGGRLRLCFELSDVLSSEVIWSGRHEIPLDDLFTTQEAVAAKIAYALIPHVRHCELQRAARKPPENIGAYLLVLQALHRFHRDREGDFEAVHTLLNEAIEQDAAYSAAYAWQARWYMARIGRVISRDFAADAKEAQRFALLALEHDPLNPLALAIYGHCISFLFKQCERALEAFDKALAVSPSHALAWVFSAPTFVFLGRATEAIERAERGLMLSPLDPMIAWTHVILALAHYFAGNYAESVRWSGLALPSSSKDSPAYRTHIAALVALKRIEEAREAARAYAAAAPNFRVGSFLARYPLRDPAALALYGQRLLSAGLAR
jgi:adenylate cyclase